MNSAASKEKGSSFERACATRLSMWVSDMQRDDVFWRSAMSGGRYTVRSRSESKADFSAHSGDLVATHPLGNLLIALFVVECKFWRSLSLEPLFFDRKCDLRTAWEKVVEEAQQGNKCPMMLAKQNQRPELMLLTAEGYRILVRGLVPGRTLDVRAQLPRYGMYIVGMNNVLVDVDFNRIRARFKVAPQSSARPFIEVHESLV